MQTQITDTEYKLLQHNANSHMLICITYILTHTLTSLSHAVILLLISSLNDI